MAATDTTNARPTEALRLPEPPPAGETLHLDADDPIVLDILEREAAERALDIEERNARYEALWEANLGPDPGDFLPVVDLPPAATSDAGVDAYLAKVERYNATRPRHEQFEPGRPGLRHWRRRDDGTIRWVKADTDDISEPNLEARRELWPYGTPIQLQEGKKDRIAPKGRTFLEAWRIGQSRGMALILDKDIIVADLDTHRGLDPEPDHHLGALDVLKVIFERDSPTRQWRTPTDGCNSAYRWPPGVPHPKTVSQVFDFDIELLAADATVVLPGTWIKPDDTRPGGTYEVVGSAPLRMLTRDEAYRLLLFGRAHDEFKAIKHELDEAERQRWIDKKIGEIDGLEDPEAAWHGPAPSPAAYQLQLLGTAVDHGRGAYGPREVPEPREAVRPPEPAAIPKPRSGLEFLCRDPDREAKRRLAKLRRDSARRNDGRLPVSERPSKFPHRPARPARPAPTPHDERWSVTQPGKRSQNAYRLAKDYYRAGLGLDRFYDHLERSPLGQALFRHKKRRGASARRYVEQRVWNPAVARVDTAKSHHGGGRGYRTPQEVYGDPAAAAALLAFLRSGDFTDEERLVGMLLAIRAALHGRTFHCSRAQMVAMLDEAGVTYDHDPGATKGEFRKVQPNKRHAEAIVESLQAKGAVRLRRDIERHGSQAYHYTITAPARPAEPQDHSCTNPSSPAQDPLRNSSSEGVSPPEEDPLAPFRMPEEEAKGLYPGMPVRLLTDEELERVRSRSMLGLPSDWYLYWRGAEPPERSFAPSELALAA